MANRRWISSKHPRDAKGRFARKGGGSSRSAARSKGPKARKTSFARRNARLAVGAALLFHGPVIAGAKEAGAAASYLAARQYAKKAGRAAANRGAKELLKGVTGAGARRATARAGVYTITTLAGRKFR